MSIQLNPVPGWYADPVVPGMLRWWDGYQWSPVQQPLRPPKQPPPIPEYAGKNERLGRFAMLSWAAVSVLITATIGYLIGTLVDDFIQFVRDTEAAAPGEIPQFPVSIGRVALVVLAGMLNWVPLALFMAWACRCATAGAALRIPARLEPIWAVVGWIVPVLSYWFPYQSVGDCLQPDHEQRRAVGWWWAGHLTAAHTPILVVGAAVLGTIPFMITLIVHTGIVVATAVVGLKVVRAIDVAHREALAATGNEPTPTTS